MNLKQNQKYSIFTSFSNMQTFSNFFNLKKKVFIKLNGYSNETGVRILNEENKIAFQRSSVDTFLMSVKK